jgi:orotate phosphoribosyltransferase
MEIRVPSGKTYGTEDINLICELGKIGFIKYREKPFKLKSGVMSNVYVYGRDELTAHPHILWQLGRRMLLAVRERMDFEGDSRNPCFIGLPTAGTPLAQAAAMVDSRDYLSGRQSFFFLMRSQKKTSHGDHDTWIVGKPNLERHRVIRVDNVVADGGTKFEMDERFKEDGIPTNAVDDLILVDRQQGAVKRMIERGFQNPIIIYNLLDLTHIFKALEVWPPEAIQQVEEEIHQHQFV